ncbi:MAG: 30S ribosomal protein S6 [Syntrophobacteraceae bacterium]|jgi:small subunit ribosomal protein S6|nr:30S ribosomal protein S6 [Syntrophobacteraceae bacterium]
MRKYETFFIVDPDLADEVNAVIDEKLKNIVSANGGSVLDYNPWGKKKLAYPVQKRTRGHYVLMEYAGGPELVAELERNMRLDERILKFITVKLEDRFDPEKEAARRAAPAPTVPTEEAEGKLAAVPGEMDEAQEEVEGEERPEGENEEA